MSKLRKMAASIAAATAAKRWGFSVAAAAMVGTHLQSRAPTSPSGWPRLLRGEGNGRLMRCAALLDWSSILESATAGDERAAKSRQRRGRGCKGKRGQQSSVERGSRAYQALLPLCASQGAQCSQNHAKAIMLLSPCSIYTRYPSVAPWWAAQSALLHRSLPAHCQRLQ